MERNRITSKNIVDEESLRFSARRVKLVGSRDDNRREMGGSNKMKISRASSDQPRRGRFRLGDSKIPDKKANEIQKRGMRRLY
jgi:hypothetical protein